MFENYMLLQRGFQNVKQDNQVIGFQVLVKIAYYRGIMLNLIGDFQVKVDGELFTNDKILITVGTKTFTFAETATIKDVHWDFEKPIKLTVLKPGGLAPGEHEVYFLQNIKVSYMGKGGRISTVTQKMALVV
jgi:hypothetical protein